MIVLLTLLIWTLVIYWMHRLAHILPVLKTWHFDHHKQVVNNTNHNNFHWTHIFLFFDTWRSTLDQWFTEVIPTIILCMITGQWWLFIVYYVWAAFIQESVEHNPRFNIFPFLTSGKWHLIHHRHADQNFGVFIPLWDYLFGTYRGLNVNVK